MSSRRGVIGGSSLTCPYSSRSRTLEDRRDLRRGGDPVCVDVEGLPMVSGGASAAEPPSCWPSPLADTGGAEAGDDDLTSLKEGSDMDSEAFKPGPGSEVASQSASGKATSSFPSFFAPVSASDTALSDVAFSNRTFISAFRRSEPGVENQPPGGAGVRTGSVPAPESAEGS